MATLSIPEKSTQVVFDFVERQWFQEAENRILRFDGPILSLEDYSVYAVETPIARIKRYIDRFRREDMTIPPEERKPILLYINSSGGDVDEGLALIGVMEGCKTPIYTINWGHWDSMALLIGIAGDKRFSLSTGHFLLHDGQGYLYGSGAKLQDGLENLKAKERQIKAHVLAHTRLSSEEYDQRWRTEWCPEPEQALEYGFIDKILTDLDDLDKDGNIT